MPSSLREIEHQTILDMVGNRCMSKPGIDIGAGSSDVEFNAVINYVIDGVFYSKATADSYPDDIDISGLYRIVGDTVANAAGGFAAVPTGYTIVYLLCINSSGTVRVVEGDQVANADISAGTATAECPPCPQDHAPFGCVKVANAQASASFTFGTTALSTSGVTDTYYDLTVVPKTL